jgi:hypothetical protein
MAAATIASTVWHEAGDMQFVTANLTSVADTNTWVVPGLSTVDNLIVTVNASGGAQYTSATWTTSNGVTTVTFKMSGTANLVVTAIGR